MSAPTAPTPMTAADDAVLARISALLDRAAQQSGVSPEQFRNGIREAIGYARRTNENTEDTAPEAFVLSLVRQLF